MAVIAVSNEIHAGGRPLPRSGRRAFGPLPAICNQPPVCVNTISVYSYGFSQMTVFIICVGLIKQGVLI